MPFDRFLIAPANTGLQTNLRPWLIPDDAFQKLQNAYIYRGRVRKRFGSKLMDVNPLLSRLRVNLGNTNAMTGNFSGTVPGDIFDIGQSFSIGTEIFTVYQTGTPAAMLDTGPATLATFDTTTGAVVIHGSALATAVYWYPSQPVMGLTQYEIGSVNNHPSYGFDTQFAYKYTPNSGWNRSGTAVWHTVGGSTTNFFWIANWQGLTQNLDAMFVTNFQVTNMNGAGAATDDPLWATQDGATWAQFYPYFLPGGAAVGAGPFVQTCRIIAAFKDRLVLLNTVENDNKTMPNADGTNSWYPQRCRYSWNGSPFATNAWYEPNQSDSVPNIAGGAGFIDAATDEQIVSAQFIKDRLIVYFERSTWELAYTGNEILPFVWQKINTELGSQSTFSTIPFDQAILTIGNTGVHSCNGANVSRIDTKIPQEIFKFEAKNNNPERTAGIRDYYTELAYWAFVSDEEEETQTFPNQILVYNYQNDSWALNDDCFTTFGYFEQQSDTTWESTKPLTWEMANFTWDSGIEEANQRQIIAGTPEGFVVIIDDEQGRNAPTMQITDMTIPSAVYGADFVDVNVINHNCKTGDFVAIENTVGIMLPIIGIYQVVAIIDEDNLTLFAPDVSGSYLGGGTLARVSKIEILTKQYNPYIKEDRDVHLHKVDFAVLKTEAGAITVDYFPSSTQVSMLGTIDPTSNSNAIMGTGVLETFPYDPSLYPLEEFQDRLWHPIYFQTDGNCIQLYLYFTDAQMTNRSIVWADFDLEGFCLYTQRTTSRTQ